MYQGLTKLPPWAKIGADNKAYIRKGYSKHHTLNDPSNMNRTDVNYFLRLWKQREQSGKWLLLFRENEKDESKTARKVERGRQGEADYDKEMPTVAAFGKEGWEDVEDGPGEHPEDDGRRLEGGKVNDGENSAGDKGNDHPSGNTDLSMGINIKRGAPVQIGDSKAARMEFLRSLNADSRYQSIIDLLEAEPVSVVSSQYELC